MKYDVSSLIPLFKISMKDIKGKVEEFLIRTLLENNNATTSDVLNMIITLCSCRRTSQYLAVMCRNIWE